MTWTEFRVLFTVLFPIAQREVCRFYRPHKELTKDELIGHRGRITETEPSLPNRASKHFVRMYGIFCRAFEHSDGKELNFRQAIDRFVAADVHVTQHGKNQASRHIRVYSLVQPEPDLHQVARALLEMASEQTARTDQQT